PGRLDGGYQRVDRHVRRHDAVVGRSAVVLDLLQREDVRRTQVVHDDLRRRRDARVAGGREIFDVEVGDRQPARAAGEGRDLFQQPARRDRRRHRYLEFVVAERIVHHADDGADETIAYLDGGRQGRPPGQQVVEDDALGIEVRVVLADENPAARRTRG